MEKVTVGVDFTKEEKDSVAMATSVYFEPHQLDFSYLLIAIAALANFASEIYEKQGSEIGRDAFKNIANQVSSVAGIKSIKDMEGIN